jgi:hypothetical protein
MVRRPVLKKEETVVLGTGKNWPWKGMLAGKINE